MTPMVPGKKTYLITDGPNKLDLMVALFEDPRVFREVRIIYRAHKDSTKFDVAVLIRAVERDVSLGTEAWNFSGVMEQNSSGPKNITGYFNTASRKGVLQFID